ncbi:13413_t:CDS:2 [Acaulospora colombiana]|uniref:13413_t:CDS:1 n=1 Tax=Acaulospora colombiana TaxID=27376 RepID=A0ACA9MA56_9GLOM|nr:13413_t:CDS:2 [Acaulospora colombiana]
MIDSTNVKKAWESVTTNNTSIKNYYENQDHPYNEKILKDTIRALIDHKEIITRAYDLENYVDSIVDAISQSSESESLMTESASALQDQQQSNERTSNFLPLNERTYACLPPIITYSTSPNSSFVNLPSVSTSTDDVLSPTPISFYPTSSSTLTSILNPTQKANEREPKQPSNSDGETVDIEGAIKLITELDEEDKQTFRELSRLRKVRSEYERVRDEIKQALKNAETKALETAQQTNREN